LDVMTRPVVRIEPGTLAIADLHLDVGPSGGAHEEFIDFTRRIAGAPRLIVLGDLFDAWIGPAQMELPSAQRVVSALIALTASGTAVDLVHGNRDFLVEQRFEALTGTSVFPAGFVGAIGGERILWIHGDELCTRDAGYQRLKRVLRSPTVQWLAPRLPRPFALGLARRLRKASVQALAAKPDADKEQQREAAYSLATLADCATVVVGHAHRHRDELVQPPPGTSLLVGGSRSASRSAQGVRWIVLDAFGGERDLLEVGPGGRLTLRRSR
jgi:UDP-2,3-diacylglucosamine hydrolase